MKFELPALPYARTALAPHISEETLDFHYGKHHQTYMNELEAALEGKPLANKPLEEIVRATEGGVFNDAAQVWNHSFYWKSMKPNGGGAPSGDLAQAIARDFGDIGRFRDAFAKACDSHFGSGWGWLVMDNGKLKITSTSNADLPLKHNQRAILACDVWEHAYYIDYRNARPKYVDVFLAKLVNWDFANANLEADPVYPF